MLAMHTVPPPPRDRSHTEHHKYYFWIALGCIALLSVTYWAFALGTLGGFLQRPEPQLGFMPVRSLVIDHDLRFDNEINGLTPYPRSFGDEPPWTRVKRSAEYRPFGWTLVTLVPYAATHGVMKLAGGRADGYSMPYQVVTSLWHMALCILGMAMAARAAIRLTGRTASALAFAGAFLATNVLYYATVMPMMTHAASCAIVGMLMYVAVRLLENVRRRVFWISAAILVFLLVLVCPINLPLAGVLVPAAWLLWSGNPKTMNIPKGSTTGWGPRWFIPRIALMVLALVAAWALQAFALRASTGAWVINPLDMYHEGLDPLAPAIPRIFYSSRNGAWYSHPFFIVGFAGLVWGVIKSFRPGRMFWACLLTSYGVHVYFIAAHQRWTFGEGFGHRMFVDSSPLMLVGAALLYYRMKSGIGRGALVGVFSVLIAWNLLLTLAALTDNFKTQDVTHPPSVVINAQIDTVNDGLRRVGISRGLPHFFEPEPQRP